MHISIHVPLAGNVSRRADFPNRIKHFYPRSPCGERRSQYIVYKTISIFLSTFPLRGTSRRWQCSGRWWTISIHVPLAGNVQGRWLYVSQGIHFYPRSPCGERR